MQKLRFTSIAALGTLLGGMLSCTNAALAQATVAKIKAAGQVSCGIVATPEDWNKTDLHGPLTALDAEICKAVGVAVLGPRAKVNLEAFDSELQSEEALSNGGVDLIVGVSPDATSMWHWKIAFGPTIFYDAQAILVRGDSPATALAGLAGMKVCVVEGTDNEKILLARTIAHGIAINALPFQEEGEMDDGLAVRHCDAVSAYLTRLAELQRNYPKQLSHDRILPDLLRLAPVAPAYRRDDPQWSMIVDFTVHALVQAEESGITRANVGNQRANEDPVVQRLLGVDWATSRALNLPAKDWAAQVIAAVGNYGEIFSRTVGTESPLQMPRGLNALWSHGGLMHADPVQ
jgi:general L-amino acid transport system substrate-binding protein